MSSDQIILLSDLHIHKWKQFSKLTPEGVNDRLLDGINVIDSIGAYGKKNGIETAILAGDLFHKRAVLDVETFNAVFYALKRSPLRWIIMDGNHDQATKDGRIHSLEPLQALSNVMVINKRVKLVPTERIGNTVFHFYPYQDDADATMDALKRGLVKDKTVQRVAIMHHGFKGARVGSFLEYEVKEPLDPLEAKELGYSWILSGHYHHQQAVTRGVEYIGAPMQHVRADAGEGRGFLTLGTYKVSGLGWVPIQPSAGMRQPPRFVQTNASTILSNAKAVAYAQVVEGNFVDLIMDVDDDSVVDTLYKMGARHVEPKHELRAVTKSSKRLDVSARMDPAKAVEKYVEHQVEEQQTELDPDLLKRVGKDLIKEAQEL